MALAYFNGLTALSIMENGETTKCTEKASSDGPMAEYIMESMSMIRSMVRACTLGLMGACTRANSIMVNSTAKAFIAKIMGRRFMESGKKERR